MRYIYLTIALILLSSCKLGPDYKKPDISMGENWQNHSNAELDLISKEWWKSFDDPVLDILIQEALINNHDIKTAIANVEKAKSYKKQAISGIMPEIDLNVGADRQKFSGISQRNNANMNGRRIDSAFGEVSISWEVDLFGKLRRAIEVSDAEYEYYKNLKQDVMLSVIYEIASNYFALRNEQKILDIAKGKNKVLKKMHNIYSSLFKVGRVSEIDFMNVKSNYEQQNSEIPSIESNIQALIYSISTMTGKLPEEYNYLLSQEQDIKLSIKDYNPGVRSEILRRRPDIRAAENQLAAQTAKIGIAISEFFPQFSLTGSLGQSSTIFSQVFSRAASTYGTSGSMYWPIFSGGYIKAQVEIAKIEAKQALIEYEKTIFTALKEAESALYSYQKEKESYSAIKKLVDSRKKAVQQASYLHKLGRSEYIKELEERQKLLDAMSLESEKRNNVYQSMITLFKAIGGYTQEDTET